MEHTQGKWEVKLRDDRAVIMERDSTKDTGKRLVATFIGENADTDARLTCKAVNCHTKLLDACKRLLRFIEPQCDEKRGNQCPMTMDCCHCIEAKAAIAAATE